VDPEAELIFGAIKDENMNGKIRVSIVATSLDGQKTETKTVLNMVSRIQNRNSGYSENLFSHNSNSRVENTLSSIDGATALKLDESYEIDEQNDTFKTTENNIENKTLMESLNDSENELSNIPSGVSIESASYMENHKLNENKVDLLNSENENEESTPKLFSDEQDYDSDLSLDANDKEEEESEQLFDQDINEEEDFEIPAFLRKQKF
jgi:cell division protein FtsZ